MKTFVAVLLLCQIAVHHGSPSPCIEGSHGNHIIIEEYEPKWGEKEEQNCKCMNWRSCTGKINSNVVCPQSYIDVCCILKKNPEALKKNKNRPQQTPLEPLKSEQIRQDIGKIIKEGKPITS